MFYACKIGVSDHSWAVMSGFTFVHTNLTRYAAHREARHLNAVRAGAEMLSTYYQEAAPFRSEVPE